MDRSTRQARLDRRRGDQRRGQLKWLVYIVVGAVIVAGLLIASNLARVLSYGQINTPVPHDYAQQNGNVLGDPNAPVQVIEVADFQCPYCLKAFETLEGPIISTYVNNGKVSLSFEAVGYIGPESTRAAEAAYCAGDQNRFWDYHDIVYVNQGGENSGAMSDDRLIQFAQLIGLDMADFQSCFENGDKADRVAQAEAIAAQYGISSTPSFVINGTVLVGLKSFPEIQQAIEAALAAAGAN